MKPVMQKVFEDGKGDCLRACVASILELDIDQVPNFNDATNWDFAFIDFLGQYGYYPLRVPVQLIDGERTGRYLGMEIPCWSIVIVVSPRRPTMHAIVAYGEKLVHDPYPGGNCQHEGWYREIYFVKKDPSR